MNKLTHALVGIIATLFMFASAFALSTDSFTFPNNTGKDVDDLHIEWTKAVEITSNSPFKKASGSGSSRADFSKGTVEKDGTCEIKVSYDGTDPAVKSWYWTIGGKKVRDEKVDDVVSLATGDENGMTVLVMTTGAGKITTYLPDSMWKGATIMGTVVATPNGKPGSADTLKGTVLSVGNKNISGATGSFVTTITGVGGLVSLLNSNGNTICSPPVQIGNSPAPILGDPGSQPFLPPPLAQTGKPIELPGTFDPSKPIDCSVNGKPAIVLAASPCGAVVMPTENCVGALEISIKNGSNTGSVKGCAVQVTLEAPKTTLLPGESVQVSVKVGPFVDVPANQFPCELTIDNLSPGNLKLTGAEGSSLRVAITQADVHNGQFELVLVGTGLMPGSFEIGASICGDICGAETHEFGIDKLSKGKDTKGWFVEWREDCHQGNCHKRKNHSGEHSYAWKGCKTHASKDHKDYYDTEADRDAAYEKLDKERGERRAKHGF